MDNNMNRKSVSFSIRHDLKQYYKSSDLDYFPLRRCKGEECKLQDGQGRPKTQNPV